MKPLNNPVFRRLTVQGNGCCFRPVYLPGRKVWDVNPTMREQSALPRTVIICIIALMTLHAFLMNGYYLVHKRLTVGTYLDPIVAQADPTLFKNSLYVQAVNRTNVRLSISHDFNLFIIKHFDFETFAVTQEIVSLFFSLAGIFALTRVLFGSSGAGLLAMLLYTTELNNWTLGSPAPYLNFFHHGLLYAYPLIIWSMVFFFQKRYPLSLFLSGLAWNFHPMCTVFVLWAYCLFWAFNYKELKASTMGYCILSFTLPALPAIIRSFSYLSSTQQLDFSAWITAAYWTAWFTCFPSTWPALSFVRAILFFVLFMLAVYRIPDSSRKQGLLIFTGGVLMLCLAGTVFADIYPVPFIIKMSLWRSTLIYMFMALPCIAWLLLALFNHSFTSRFTVIALIVLLTGYVKCYPFYYLPLLLAAVAFFIYEPVLKERFSSIARNFSSVFFLSLAMLLAYQIMYGERGTRMLVFFIAIIIFLLAIALRRKRSPLNAITYIVWSGLFIILIDAAVLYFKGGPEIYYHGYFQGKRHPWADMQLFAKQHSDKDDLFIVPTYMNDFGIYSQRATLGDWAEGSNAIYLDNQFTREWLTRMKDLGWKKFCFDSSAEGYYYLPTSEVVKTACKYGVKFIITEKPKIFALPKIYENEQFILYRAPQCSGTGSS